MSAAVNRQLAESIVACNVDPERLRAEIERRLNEVQAREQSLLLIEKQEHERTKAELAEARSDRRYQADKHAERQADVWRIERERDAAIAREQAALAERAEAIRRCAEWCDAANQERDAAQAELAESYAIARMREIEILAERDAAQAGVAAMRGALREIERETYTEDGLSYRHIHNLAQRGLCAGDSGHDLAARVPLLEAVLITGRELRGHESTACIVDPPCGNCAACSFNAALAALDEKGGGA